MKNKRQHQVEAFVDLGILDNGNARFPKQRVAAPVRAERDSSDIFRGYQEKTQMENKSTGKPDITAAALSLKPHTIAAEGVAYLLPTGSINRVGAGTAIKFVVVIGYGDWAIYYAPAEMSSQFVAEQGDKVVKESQINTLVNCSEIIDFYRF